MDHDGNAGNVRRIRALQQAVDRRIGAQQGRAIAGRQPRRHHDADPLQQRIEVVAPRNRDRDVADRVLEDQVPADDPCDQLAERRVRIDIGAARLRNHRGQLRVAESGERARGAQQDEREHERGPGALADHLAVRPDLSCRCRPDGAEDPGADDGADRQHDEIARPHDAFQRVLRVGQELRDWLAPEQLIHRNGF